MGSVTTLHADRRLALAYYGIAEYSTVLDHIAAMKSAGLHIPYGVAERLTRERLSLFHQVCVLTSRSLVSTVNTEPTLVAEARGWLAEHPEEIKRIEEGGTNERAEG